MFLNALTAIMKLGYKQERYSYDNNYKILQYDNELP